MSTMKVIPEQALDEVDWQEWEPAPLDPGLERHRGWAVACFFVGHSWERHPTWPGNKRCFMCGKVKAILSPGLRAAIRGNIMGSSYREGHFRHRPEGAWPRHDYNDPPARREVMP